MGKGDKKSKKGKRFRHSFGRTRQRKHTKSNHHKKKTEEKPKSIEQKKTLRSEPELEKPVVVLEPKVDEIKLVQPEISEIKEEVQISEVSVAVIPDIPEESLARLSNHLNQVNQPKKS
ncbi:MAG: 30S ribosomal protein THX [Ignavibacteriota bacterium]|nr:MAG: 30S ribosomal protein THX [Ignavibacteriota bacterium]